MISLRSSFRFAKSARSDFNFASSFSRLIASIYFEQGKNAKAIDYGEKALNLAQEYELKSKVEDAADILMNCYLKNGNYENAE